jgi:hypothetical protein
MSMDVEFLSDSWLLPTALPVRDLDELRGEHRELLEEWRRATTTRPALQDVYAAEDMQVRSAMLEVARAGAVPSVPVDVGTSPVVREVTLQAAGEREIAALEAVCGFALRCVRALEDAETRVFGVVQLRLNELHQAQVQHKPTGRLLQAPQDRAKLDVIWRRLADLPSDVASVRRRMPGHLDSIVASSVRVPGVA